MQKEFLFGSSYCPYAKSLDQDMEYWERDVRTMKDLNLNVVRFFIAWDRIERKEEICDYTKSDYMFELCQKYGIRVILAVGGMFDSYVGKYAPRWIAMNPDVQMQVPVPGESFRPFGPLRLPCPDDSYYAAKAKEFTVKTIRRYAEQPTLAGWSVWNEAFFQKYCYCPLTLEKFRSYLAEKYGTLDKLLKAWETECPLDYHSWDEVEPSLSAGYLSGGFRSGMDYYEFSRKRMMDWIDEVDALVRDNDPHRHPTTTNVYTGAYFFDKSHNFPNQFDQNRNRTIPGMSAYNTYLENCPDDQYKMSEAYSMSRSAGNGRKNGFWVLETEAGILTGARKNRAAMELEYRTAANFQAIMHGARAILLWKYNGRVSDALSITCMLTGWDGSITPRAEEAAAFSAFVRKHQELFLSRRYHARVAVLSSQISEIYGIVNNSIESMVDGRHGAYKLLLDHGIQTDFIDDIQLKNDTVKQYKLLIVPATLSLDRESAEALRGFVEAGGHLFVDRFFHIYGKNGERFQRAPGNGLNEVFGAHLYETHFAGDDETFASSDPLEGEECSWVRLESATALAEYSSGKTAVSSHEYGFGRAYLCGVPLFHRYLRKRDSGIHELWSKILDNAELFREIIIEGNTNSVECGTMSNPELSPVHFLINFSNDPVSFRLTLRFGGYFSDLRSNFRYQDMPIEVELKSYQVMILTQYQNGLSFS